ncbi:MAG: T9SS type A sorting domain-containing protein [Flavobacteriales bacterium]|nr:T9SS type A sorting domain-containing protein [Flavobacteriales bacterium]
MKTLIISVFACLFISLANAQAPVALEPNSSTKYINQKTYLKLSAGVADGWMYYFELDTTPNFNSPFKMVDSILALTSIDWEILQYGFDKTYYWRCRARLSNGYSPYSDTLSFTTQKFLYPYLPASGTAVNDAITFINTDDYGSGLEYIGIFDTTSDFSSAAATSVSGTSTSGSRQFKLDKYPFGSRVYFHAKAYLNYGSKDSTKEYENDYYFDVASNPTLNKPANLSAGIDTQYYYVVNKIGNTTSLVELSEDDETFQNPIIYNGSTGYFKGLKFGATYYWRAKSRYTGIEDSKYSDVWSFSTKYQMTKPIISLPINGQTIKSDSVQVQWLSVSEADYYEIYLDTTSLFLNPTKIISTLESYTIYGLTNGKYHIKIRAVNAYGYSPMSNDILITLDKMESIATPVSNNFEILNTPDSWVILNTANNSIKSATIYDLNGKILQNVLCHNNQIRIEKSNFISGMYIVKLESNEAVFGSKLIKF